MNNIPTILFLDGIAAVVQIYFGFLYYIDRLRSNWSLLKRGALCFTFLTIFLCFSFWITRDRTFVDKNDLRLPLREIAESAYKKSDFDTTVKAVTFALRFHPDDEDLLRMRARAYKRLGPQYYEDEIRDRKLAVIYNPDRQENHLPIIEDYILQKKYDNAEAWIEQNANKITDHEVKLMFEFFAVVCQILKGEEHTSAVKNLESEIRKTPLSKKFIENFWSSKYLMDFLNENPFPESSKKTIKELDDLLRQTAR
jgi:hypothetical protein